MFCWLDSSNLSSIGAILIVLATVVEPFAQQLTAYPQRSYTTGLQAALPVRWLGPTPGMHVPVFDAIYQSESANLSHTCMTGDCSWDGYQYLAVCSQCTNITDLVQVNRFCSHSHNESCGWRLPNGLSIDYDRILRSHNAVMNTTCDGDSLYLQNLWYVIANFTRLDVEFPGECQFNRSQNALKCTQDAMQVHATECVLFWCLNKYTATVNGADLIETHISSWWNRSDHSAVSIPFSGSSFYQLHPNSSDWPDGIWSQTLTGNAKEVGDETSPVTLNDNATGIQTFSVDQSGHEAFSGWLRSLMTLSNTGLQEQSSSDPDSDLVDILIDVGPYGN